MRNVPVNTRYVTLWIAIAIVIFCVDFTTAEESSWKLPNLNPFGSKGQPPTAARAPKSGGSTWKMPKLWPGSSAKRPTGQPTMLQKATTGTKQFFSKTADALNPWDDANDQPPPRPSGSNSAFSRATKKKKESTGSGLSPASWWTSEEKDDRDKTVNDFLSRPRPGN
jgi:hypothetical protein